MVIKVVEIRYAEFEAESLEEFEKDYDCDPTAYDSLLNIADTVITDRDVVTDARVLIK